jgi:hypothetical protein
MTLEEAIKTLELENKHPWNKDNSELRQAVKLGIEALKRIKGRRDLESGWEKPLLPGETEE